MKVRLLPEDDLWGDRIGEVGGGGLIEVVCGASRVLPRKVCWVAWCPSPLPGDDGGQLVWRSAGFAVELGPLGGDRTERNSALEIVSLSAG